MLAGRNAAGAQEGGESQGIPDKSRRRVFPSAAKARARVNRSRCGLSPQRRHQDKDVMALLEIKDLHVEIDGKEILKGLDLAVNAGEVHAIMGPNGSGKSTLAYVLAGKQDYQPTAGTVLFDGRNLFDMQPDERAAAGLFLAFQYPLEIPGVATMTFLRTALNAQRKKRGEAELSTPEFIKKVREVAGKLGIEQEMLRRAVNVGFSGGEKKRNEILQMALLEPQLAVLDETDSGLDIDALKIVADGVNRLRSPRRASIVITHYQRLLTYIVPDVVHVLSRGRIVKTGGKDLALELEARGYAEYQEEAAA
jgi:Fe-S cluster assembly ATP-binding protein